MQKPNNELSNFAKSPSVDIQQLRTAVTNTTTPSIFILRDLAYFLEILHQKEIQKDQKKKYKMKMKRKVKAIKQRTEEKS